MKILVIGKGGQLSEELIRNDSPILEIDAVGRQEVDLTDLRRCANVIRDSNVDAVINAAAYTAVDQAEDEEALANLINAEAPCVMAQACVARNIPFLHVSTDYVFDGSGVDAWAETDRAAPLNAYGRSKLKGELGVLATGQSSAILRTSWVFSSKRNNFVKTMLRLAERNGPLNIVSDQVGGPTAAKDIARVLLSMAQSMVHGQSGGLYHFSGSPYVSWSDFAREIFVQCGVDIDVIDIPTSDYPTRAKRPLNSRLDCGAIMRDFGIKQPDWRLSLEKVLQELK